MFWQDARSRRVLVEDALKHIYKCEYDHITATTLSLSGALGFKLKRTLSLIETMQQRGLIRLSGDNITLEPPGRALAIQVIRAHRLWESYLAEAKGVPMEAIHEEAERQEHAITPAQADALEEQLGYPQYDPHGDPIPSLRQPRPAEKMVPLTDWPQGRYARITHIEDEPQTVYEQILAEGLLVGTYVNILSRHDDGLHLWTNIHECWLAPVLAANIFVKGAREWTKEIHGVALSHLVPPQKGKVLALQCHGVLKRRFLDLGLLPGTIIEAVMCSALGEPLAYKIRETMIALRKEQADQILIKIL